MSTESEKVRLTITIQSALIALVDKNMKERFIDNRSSWITEAIVTNLKRIKEEEKKEQEQK